MEHRVLSELINRLGELARIDRLYNALRLINQTIVRSERPEEMLQDVCKIMVENGGFLLAWIGWREEGKDGIVSVANYGDTTGYVSAVFNALRGATWGQPPSGRTLATGEPYVCNCFASDLNLSLLHEVAARAGIRSCASVPIQSNGRVEGVLCVYASEEDVFQENEVALLFESASDIAYALDRFASEAREREAYLRNHQMAAKLTLLQSRQQAIIDNLDEGLIMTNSAGTFFQINGTAAEMFGYTSDYRPKSMNDAPSFIEICGLDGKPIPFNDWPLALVFRGEAVENREYLVRQLATGREKIFSYNGRLFTGEDGDEIVLLSVRDVTQRKLAEEALRLSEARLRRAQSIARLGSWELTLADQMMWLSAETALMLGFGADALSMPLSEFREHLEPDDLDALDLATDAALAGIAVFDVEMRFQTTSGRTHVFYSQADIMFDDFGKVRGLAGTLMDISEKHELQSQFLQAQKMEAIGRLSGGVAHDFNNALSIIGGYGELLLLEDCLSNQDGHQYVRRILEAHEQARGLTKQLLAFSRKQPVSKTPVDLNEAVEGLSEMLRRLIGEDIYLDVCCDPRSMVTVADKGQLEQVVMNLVVNARDAMPKGGRISISTNLTEVDPARDSALSNLSRGQYAILRVRDTGCGMDEATKAKIFEPFFTTKSAGQGTGLGLSTVYGIVSQYSGAVTVQSNVGQGTTFSIYLPVAESRTNSLPSAQNLASRTGGSESILLLEDSESMRTLLSRSLRSVGYRVFCAADGKEAMAIANANGGSIDLLLSDVILPGLSGPEVAKQLKQTLPHIRCLFMSGYTDEFLARSQALGGILDVIDKPFQMDALLQRIRKVLETPEVFARLA